MRGRTQALSLDENLIGHIASALEIGWARRIANSPTCERNLHFALAKLLVPERSHPLKKWLRKWKVPKSDLRKRNFLVLMRMNFIASKLF